MPIAQVNYTTDNIDKCINNGTSAPLFARSADIEFTRLNCRGVGHICDVVQHFRLKRYHVREIFNRMIAGQCTAALTYDQAATQRALVRLET